MLSIRRILVVLGFVWAALTTTRAIASPNPADYPLRIVVYHTHWSEDYFGNYSGYGRANLVDGSHTNAIEYTFNCDEHFMSSDAERGYAAKWRKPGTDIEMLVGDIGSNHVTKCSLKVAVKDYVYRKHNGELETISQAEFADRSAREAESRAALQPEDTDLAHYPLKFAMLHVELGGRTAHLYSGSGQGNVVEPSGEIHAADFAIHCPVVVHDTPDGRFYMAKWDEQGKELTLLLHNMEDSTKAATCSLKTTLHTDVYVREASGLHAVSQEDYKHIQKAGPESASTH